MACVTLLPLTGRAELSNDPLLGPGLRSRPAYDGSADSRTEWVPVVRYLGPIAFVRSTQGVLEGGARLELAPGLHLGAQLAYEPGRVASESPFLVSHNGADIARGVSVGAQLEVDHSFGPMPVTLLARVRQQTESARGAQADLRLSAGVFKSGRFGAGVYSQLTWASAKSTATVYGVTPQQSARMGLPVYAAGSGLLFSSFGLLWSVDLDANWIVVGSAEARHLRGDAARSPITNRTSNNYVNAGIAYRF